MPKYKRKREKETAAILNQFVKISGIDPESLDSSGLYTRRGSEYTFFPFSSFINADIKLMYESFLLRREYEAFRLGRIRKGQKEGSRIVFKEKNCIVVNPDYYIYFGLNPEGTGRLRPWGKERGGL